MYISACVFAGGMIACVYAGILIACVFAGGLIACVFAGALIACVFACGLIACVFAGILIACVYADGLIACVFAGGLVQGDRQMTDERNYSSLADEFDVAAATSDEVILGDADTDDVDVSTVRRRLPVNLDDNV